MRDRTQLWKCSPLLNISGPYSRWQEVRRDDRSRLELIEFSKSDLIGGKAEKSAYVDLGLVC